MRISLLNRVNNSCNFIRLLSSSSKSVDFLEPDTEKENCEENYAESLFRFSFSLFFYFLFELIYLIRPSTSVETSFTCNPGTVDCISNCLAANTGTDAREVCYNINFLSLILRGDAILRISPVSPSMCKHTMGTSWLNILRSLRSRKV